MSFSRDERARLKVKPGFDALASDLMRDYSGEGDLSTEDGKEYGAFRRAACKDELGQMEPSALGNSASTARQSKLNLSLTGRCSPDIQAKL
jgi:hypothetical protein